MSVRRSAVAVALALSAAAPAASAPTMECCRLLAKEFPEDVSMPSVSTYDVHKKDFWSLTESSLNPSCVFLPDCTSKVSKAIKLLAENDCQFSIKGGGHSVIPGAANIEKGVLIPAHKFNSIDISPDKTSARVGMGRLMGEIYTALDKENVTAMIGRWETVGMGVTLGAGFNYLMNGKGMSVDNILNFEVVLGDGSVVNANATSHPDLFKALKGGNNNFGYVTHATLALAKTEGAIYGGQIIYGPEQVDKAHDLVWDYHTRQAVDDTLTHVLPQFGYNGSSDTTSSINLIVYNKNVDKMPKVLKGWEEIPAENNTMKNTQYHTLSAEVAAPYPDGLVQEQRVFTVYADKQLYKDLWDRYHAWLRTFRHIPGLYGLHCNMPITPRVIAEGVAKGGNSLGLENSGNRTLGIQYFGLTFTNMADAAEVLPAHDAIVKELEEMARSRGLLNRYIMLTYSGYNQPAIASYGPENVRNLLAAQAKYDPTKVFTRLVPGGQKLPTTA